MITSVWSQITSGITAYIRRLYIESILQNNRNARRVYTAGIIIICMRLGGYIILDKDILQIDYEAEFAKLTSDQLRTIAAEFLDSYEMPKTKFARRVNLSSTTLNRWLLEGDVLNQRSLRRIFDFLVEYFPRWKECVE